MEYTYKATNRITGENVSGVATAENMRDLVVQLKTKNLIPLDVDTKKIGRAARSKSRYFFFRKIISGKELAVFTRQLAATLSAGLLLTEALETIADDLENKRFRNVIRELRENIQSGSEFSAALSRFPHLFPMTYVAIVRSGEATGNLHVTMRNLAEYLESTERMKNKVINAVRYPAFVVSFACLVVAVIVLFLIPKFETMFLQAGAQLPLLTRIVVAVSNFCLKYTPFLMGAGAIGMVVFAYMKRFPKFQYGVDAAKLRIPILGKEIIHKALVSRFCRTLGFLFCGGVGLSKALEITGEVVDHRVMQKAVETIRQRVVSGASLSAEMKKQDIFPALSSKMVGVGEKTGKVHQMLTKTSEYYEEELDSSLQALTTMLEPALIIFIGAIVLIVVLALYLPIFQMSSAVG